MTNFEQLFEQEKEYRMQVQQQYDEYKEKSAEIEEYLEGQLVQAEDTLAKKDKEIEDLKVKLSQNKADSEKFIRSLEREVDSLRQKYELLQQNNKKEKIKLVQLENEVESLESQNRVLETMNNDLEQKIDSIVEELALLQTELEENRQNHQNDIENIERLKQQIRDTESELFAQQMKHQIQKDSQENNKNLYNQSISRGIQSFNSTLSNASTSSTSSSNLSSKAVHINQKNKNGSEQEEIDSLPKYKTNLVKKARSITHNMSCSFNSFQVDTLSKIFAKTQLEQRVSTITQNNDQNINSNYISEKDSSSNNSSGQKDENDIQEADKANQQRGRKLACFTGIKTERYSEEKRRLQQKIIKDNINMYDKNINNLKQTDIGFSKSLNLISNLIKDLDEKMVKIRSKKAQLGTPRNLSTAKNNSIEAAC